MGTIYKRGAVWWIRYRKNGQNIFESAKSEKKMVASELLTSREAAINEGRPILLKHGNFDYLKNLILDDYSVNKKRSLERLNISISHLGKYFQGYKADHITTSDIKGYIKTRQGQEAMNGTINRELACLRRMLNLAMQDEAINRMPHFPMLKEGNPRQGFFENDEYIKLLKELPGYLRPIVTFAYRTGWRKQEILKLTWDRVDLKERYIHLNPDQTKNSEARSIYVGNELFEMLRVQRFRTDKKCPYVFHNNGRLIKDFRGAWEIACKDSSLSGKMFHDFRRTAARNLTRSGVQETVAMKITGHKTRSVFDRYNITSQDDIRAAVERQENYLSEKSVTKTVTIGQFSTEGQKDNQAQVINISK